MAAPQRQSWLAIIEAPSWAAHFNFNRYSRASLSMPAALSLWWDVIGENRIIMKKCFVSSKMPMSDEVEEYR